MLVTGIILTRLDIVHVAGLNCWQGTYYMTTDTPMDMNVHAVNKLGEAQMIKFTVPGIPRGKERPRFANGVVYTPKQTQNYEALVKLMAHQNPGRYIASGAIELYITAYLPIPQSASKKNKLKMLNNTLKATKKIDADNIAKVIMDSLNGILYHDDRQVIRLIVEKRYAKEARTEVCIQEVD